MEMNTKKQKKKSGYIVNSLKVDPWLIMAEFYLFDCKLTVKTREKEPIVFQVSINRFLHKGLLTQNLG